MTKKEKIEFRYYEIPKGEYILPLLGKSWMRGYGLSYLHFHNYMEIGVCHYGDGETVIEDRHYPFHDTAVTIIPPNIPHDARTVNDHSYWEWLYIDVEGIVNEMYPDNKVLSRKIRNRLYENSFSFDQSEQPALMNILNTIIKESAERKYLYKESIKGLLRSLIVELLRINKYEQNLKRKDQNMLFIAPAIDHAEKNYREDIRISEMAEVCNISESYFRKLFFECMGIQPLEFLHMIRIQKACELISKTNRSIESISYETGYKNISTFIRNFKKFLGVTPYQWKKSDDNSEGKLLNFRVSVQKGWFYE